MDPLIGLYQVSRGYKKITSYLVKQTTTISLIWFVFLEKKPLPRRLETSWDKSVKNLTVHGQFGLQILLPGANFLLPGQKLYCPTFWVVQNIYRYKKKHIFKMSFRAQICLSLPWENFSYYLFNAFGTLNGHWWDLNRCQKDIKN